MIEITISVGRREKPKVRKWDYIRLPDGSHRYWPESIRMGDYYIQASRNSVLVYRNRPRRDFCGSVYRTERFEVKDSVDAPDDVRFAALALYDAMLIGTLNQHREEGG